MLNVHNNAWPDFSLRSKWDGGGLLRCLPIGRHDSGIFGRHDSGIFSRHDSGIFSRHDSGIFGPNEPRYVFFNYAIEWMGLFRPPLKKLGVMLSAAKQPFPFNGMIERNVMRLLGTGGRHPIFLTNRPTD